MWLCQLPIGRTSSDSVTGQSGCPSVRREDFARRECALPILPALPTCVPPSCAPSSSRFSVSSPVWTPPWPDQAGPIAESNRINLTRQANEIFGAGWEASTTKRYSSGVRVVIGGAEAELELSLLPMDSCDKLVMAFTRMAGQSWSTTRTNKSAIRAWHVSRGLPSVFDTQWSPQVALFWRGLKKKASHTSMAKVAVSIEALWAFQCGRLQKGTSAGVRDAAWAGVCFFGVRRSAETIQLRIEDLAVKDGSIVLFIRQQKNDPFGHGMHCFIAEAPRIR